MESDFLSSLSSDDTKAAEDSIIPSGTSTGGSAELMEKTSNFTQQNKNTYEDTFTPVEIDPGYMIRGSKEYYVTAAGDVPTDVLETVMKIATNLKDVGMVLRSNMNGEKDKLNGVASERAANEKVVYLPWKGFMKEQVDRGARLVNSPAPICYGVATRYSKIFNKMKPGVRSFIARDTGLIFGDDCKTPIQFMLCYSEDGAEKRKELTANTGYSYYPIMLCNEIDIPVFNLKKPDAIDRFKAFLSTL